MSFSHILEISPRSYSSALAPRINEVEFVEKEGTIKMLKKLLTCYSQTAQMIRPPMSSFAYFLGVSKVSSLSFGSFSLGSQRIMNEARCGL